jgi:uncharacterized membrane protein YhaH (DUF805 family)
MTFSTAPANTTGAMSFGQAIASGFRKFVTWKGRASRSEFWWWYLFAVIVSIPFSAIYQASTVSSAMAGEPSEVFTPAYFLLSLVSLVLFVPTLSAAVRRLHDTNHSGGWCLIFFVPFGFIVLLVFLLKQSDVGANRFDA